MDPICEHLKQFCAPECAKAITNMLSESNTSLTMMQMIYDPEDLMRAIAMAAQKLKQNAHPGDDSRPTGARGIRITGFESITFCESELDS